MSSRIPKKQRGVIFLLLKNYSISSIATELNITAKKVYRLLDKLQKKGFVCNESRGIWKVTEAGGSSSLMVSEGGQERGTFFPTQELKKPVNWIRLHNLQITVNILKPFPKSWDKEKIGIFYRNQPKSFGLTKYLDLEGYDVTGRIYKKCIVIQIPEITKDDMNECEKEALNILFRTLRLIEHRYKLHLIKDGYLNMKVNKSHYALIHNELAETFHEEKKTLKIYHKDGKLRLVIDNSYNELEGAKSPEFEATHPQEAPTDGRNIKQFFEEFIDNPFMPKDVMLLREQNKRIMSVLDAYATQIEKHLLVQDKTLQTQEETLKTLKSMRKAIQGNTKPTITPQHTNSSKAPVCSLREWL